MLPTTGHFKNISCPFYDACICERPYCHFKHSKRDSLNDTNLISELVSKAVHKVLNSNTSSSPDTNEKSNDGSNYLSTNGNNVTYNPTPISELNKYKTTGSGKEISEKKNRHIPIQYTPEQPRSVRSVVANNITNSIDQVAEDKKKSLTGYSPTSTTQSCVNYIPSSIKTLTDNSNSDQGSDSSILTSHISSENNSHQYVPFNLNSEDTEESTLAAEYNPTKNLLLDTTPSYNEYVPKYNDEFIDEFINDPNIYEPSEIVNKTNNENEIHLKTEKNHRSDVEKTHSCEKEKTDSKKSNKSRSNGKSCDRSQSSNLNHSKQTSKSKHKEKEKKDDRRKDSEHNSKELNEYKRSEKKRKSRSRSRDKHRKSVRSRSRDKCKKQILNDSKINDNVKISEVKNKLKELPDNHCSSLIADHLVDNYINDLSDESDDELEQCKRIFEEYKPPAENAQLKEVSKSEALKEDTNMVVPLSKKRIAHEKSSNVIRRQCIKSIAVKSAALIMANRYKQVLSNIKDKNMSTTTTESAENPSFPCKRPLNKTNDKITDEASQDLSFHNPAKIKRIAHVPNVSSLLNAKKKVEEIAKTKTIPKTPMQTIAKGTKRIAHIPEVTIADIPNVLHSEKSKLPINVRNKYLFLMVKECTKLYVSKQAAYDRALNEEFNCYSKCSAIATYRNSVMLSVNRLRKEAESGQGLSSPSSSNSTSDFEGKRFYENIYKWILTEDELVENGYPRPGASKKGYALFKTNKDPEKVPENSQLCIRCKKIYKVDDAGFQLYAEDCIYHPGSRFVFRGETKYICCKESVANSGCCVCSNHVFEIRDPANLCGFVSTFQPETSNDPKSFSVYALDCEMVYTTKGFELARITVIDSHCEVVYESLIKPSGYILDYNTRFSGITTSMLENVSTKITEVQATLLLMFNSKTILIGHSLESDLKALRLIHSTVIDTSVLFPHKMGPPKKRGLRMLASEFLKKIIQNEEGGHDSAEDAITCMELVIWKLKEEIKLR